MRNLSATDRENEIKGGIKSFAYYVTLGWDVELAFECAYDTVYDVIEKEAFIDRCQQSVKAFAAAQKK
jgi:hypothetical protein